MQAALGTDPAAPYAAPVGHALMGPPPPAQLPGLADSLPREWMDRHCGTDPARQAQFLGAFSMVLAEHKLSAANIHCPKNRHSYYVPSALPNKATLSQIRGGEHGLAAQAMIKVQDEFSIRPIIEDTRKRRMQGTEDDDLGEGVMAYKHHSMKQHKAAMAAAAAVANPMADKAVEAWAKLASPLLNQFWAGLQHVEQQRVNEYRQQLAIAQAALEAEKAAHTSTRQQLDSLQQQTGITGVPGPAPGQAAAAAAAVAAAAAAAAAGTPGGSPGCSACAAKDCTIRILQEDKAALAAQLAHLQDQLNTSQAQVMALLIKQTPVMGPGQGQPVAGGKVLAPAVSESPLTAAAVGAANGAPVGLASGTASGSAASDA